MKYLLNKLVATCLFLVVPVAFSASFDCGKAKTYHEKFICSNPQLDALDKQLGESYSNANKSFVLKGYIPAIHKSWLSSYRECAGSDKIKKSPADALRICSDEVVKRIDLYGDLTNASVYTNSKDKNFYADGETYIIYEKNQNKILRYFGGWMPNGNMDTEKMKGFPYDGYWCDGAMQLKRKGSAYTIVDSPEMEFTDGISDDFEIRITDKLLVVKGSINCGLRASIGDAKFDRK